MYDCKELLAKHVSSIEKIIIQFFYKYYMFTVKNISLLYIDLCKTLLYYAMLNLSKMVQF